MERKSYPLIDFLKPFREDDALDSAGRLFRNLAPRKEKDVCPFAEFFFGNLKSVSVFRRLQKEHTEFLVKRLHRYCGAKSLSDLKTIVLDSLSMSSSMAIQLNSTIVVCLGYQSYYKCLSLKKVELKIN